MTKEAYRIRKIQLANAGDWNGEQAMRAWAEGNEAEYARLIQQADSLWAQAKAIKA